MTRTVHEDNNTANGSAGAVTLEQIKAAF